MKTLDVGCGSKPRGHVNVDLLVPDDEWKRTVNPKIIPNFVRADARFLPFRNCAFELCVASHLLEHSNVPSCLLREMLRVAQRVRIILPNELQALFDIVRPAKRKWIKKHHVWQPTLFNIRKLVAPFNYKIRIKLLEYEIEVWK